MCKKELDEKVKNLIMFRGTKEEIYIKLNSFNPDAIAATNFTKSTGEADSSFEVCLGVADCVYLDYEIFVLPTNKKNSFLITEVNSF